MFIQTESTPNPETMKFIPGVEVLPNSTATYSSLADAAKSPLARRLLGLDGVRSVFFSGDFITITKSDSVEWHVIKPHLLTSIMDHFVAGLPVIETGESSSADPVASDLSEIEQQIVEIIENRVRPAVAMDGGDITFHSFENGIVKLSMHGSCSGCPSSTATLKNGIENMLRHYVPEVEAVEAV